MKKSQPPSIDWQSVLNKLTYSALRWMIQKRVNRDDPMIKGLGPPDLAQNALQVVLEQYHQLVDAGSEEDILKIAHRIMWRDFLDIVRSSDYRGKEDLETAAENVAVQKAATQQQEAEDESFAKEYYELASDDQELKDILDAVLALGQYKREDVADLLTISPQEVTNRLRRFRYQYMARQKKSSKAGK